MDQDSSLICKKLIMEMQKKSTQATVLLLFQLILVINNKNAAWSTIFTFFQECHVFVYIESRSKGKLPFKNIIV